MKEITKEEVVKKVVGYEAVDGTKFADKEECLAYEKSCKAIIKKRFMDCVIGITNAYSFFNYGCDDDDIYVLLPKDRQDIDYINQYLTIIDYYGNATPMLSDDCIGKETFIIIGCCSEWFTILGTMEDIINTMTNDVNNAKERNNK